MAQIWHLWLIGGGRKEEGGRGKAGRGGRKGEGRKVGGSSRE